MYIYTHYIICVNHISVYIYIYSYIYIYRYYIYIYTYMYTHIHTVMLRSVEAHNVRRWSQTRELCTCQGHSKHSQPTHLDY